MAGRDSLGFDRHGKEMEEVLSNSPCKEKSKILWHCSSFAFLWPVGHLEGED